MILFSNINDCTVRSCSKNFELKTIVARWLVGYALLCCLFMAIVDNGIICTFLKTIGR